VHHSHVISAGFGIVLLACVCIAKIYGSGHQFLIGWFNVFSLGYLLIYAMSMRTIFQFESRRVLQAAGGEAGESAKKKEPLTKSVLLFSLFSAMIVAAALYLPDVADRIGKITGMSQTFIGSSLVAITTSLPEVVVSLSAARMGAFDMAVGNVLGSNLFNVAILGIEDICYTKGSLLTDASSQHIMSALVAIMTTGIAVIGVTFRAEKKLLAMTWDSFAILGCYLATSYWLFVAK